MKLRNIITKEICDAEMREDGIYIKANWSDEEKWFRYDLETLARGWDYYIEPKEPLIKHEKIRKAVRAWAEANNFLDDIEVHSLTAGTRFSILNYDIEFLGYFVYDLESNKTYTIDELCGEEEE